MDYPCLTCGACCAFFHISLPRSETETILGGEVPLELTEPIDTHHVTMRGTWRSSPRCVALDGQIGQKSFCTIYSRRPTICRKISPSWACGQPNRHCDQARIAHGLTPLTPADWPRPHRLAYQDAAVENGESADSL